MQTQGVSKLGKNCTSLFFVTKQRKTKEKLEEKKIFKG
jgi:hypothetical protein